MIIRSNAGKTIILGRMAKMRIHKQFLNFIFFPLQTFESSIKN